MAADCFKSGRFVSLAAEVLAACREKSLHIAVAESCTGGLLGVALTAVAGSSDVFERGFITYTNDAKVEMLGVRATTLEAHGAVSEEVAAEMAAGALSHSNAQVSLSITGIAGPGGSEFKPEGRVCFGISSPLKTYAETVEFGAIGRGEVRAAAVKHALTMILEAV